MTRKAGSGNWQMMEMPDGITTSNGSWFRITSKQINEYVPGLLKRTPLESIIRQADAWILCADAISLLLYFLLVFLTVTPVYAFVVALMVYFFLFYNSSAIVSVGISKLLVLISNDGFLYGLSAVLLIGISLQSTLLASFSMSVDLNAIWYGIILLFLFKVGLLRLLLKWIDSKSSKAKIDRQDRILNLLLIRYGMHHGILTKSVNEMQDELIRLQNYHKTRKKP